MRPPASGTCLWRLPLAPASGRFPLAVCLPRPAATATTRRVSRQLINEYRAELDRLRQVSGSRREGVLSEAHKDLLKR